MIKIPLVNNWIVNTVASCHKDLTNCKLCSDFSNFEQKQDEQLGS